MLDPLRLILETLSLYSDALLVRRQYQQMGFFWPGFGHTFTEEPLGVLRVLDWAAPYLLLMG